MVVLITIIINIIGVVGIRVIRGPLGALWAEQEWADYLEQNNTMRGTMCEMEGSAFNMFSPEATATECVGVKPTFIDEMRTGTSGQLFHPERLIPSNAANTVGKQNLCVTRPSRSPRPSVRKLRDSCGRSAAPCDHSFFRVTLIARRGYRVGLLSPNYNVRSMMV